MPAAGFSGMGGGGAQLTGMFAEPVPFNTVSFRYLGAQGQARELVRFSYGGNVKVAFSPTDALNIPGYFIGHRVPGPLGRLVKFCPRALHNDRAGVWTSVPLGSPTHVIGAL